MNSRSFDRDTHLRLLSERSLDVQEEVAQLARTFCALAGGISYVNYLCEARSALIDYYEREEA